MAEAAAPPEPVEQADWSAPFPGTSLPSDPPEAVSADAALLGLDAAGMAARFSRIFSEAADLLYGGVSAPPSATGPTPGPA